MTGLTPRGEQLALTTTGDSADALTFRSGSEAAGVVEALYLRLFVIALVCMQFVCVLAIVVALVRTQNANFARTATLALAMALLAALVQRAPARGYRALRRRPVLSLGPPFLALGALVLDGVTYSPLSYAAAVSIAFAAFVCGRRWSLAAATLVSVGAIASATLTTGSGALNSVGQGAAGYFVWALVLAGLAEHFAQLTMRMPAGAAPAVVAAAPLRVPNLAGDRPLRTSEATDPFPATTAAPSAPDEPPGTGRLTARQLQVVALLADGLRAEDIAARLGVATATVYRHVERAKERTGVRTRSELVAFAVRAGVAPAGGSE